MKKSVLLSWNDYQKMMRKKGKDQDVETTTIYTDERILATIPKRVHQRAKSLLEFMHSMTNLSWDSKGTVTIKGTVITGSNICDIMKAALCHYYKDYKPKGLDVFLALLSENNVPETLIQNKCRLNNIETSSTSSSWFTY